MPNIVKRKKAAVIGGGTVGSINATPTTGNHSINEEVGKEQEQRERPSLMGALKDVGVVAREQKRKNQKNNGDYDIFLQNMEGLL